MRHTLTNRQQIKVGLILTLYEGPSVASEADWLESLAVQISSRCYETNSWNLTLLRFIIERPRDPNKNKQTKQKTRKQTHVEIIPP